MDPEVGHGIDRITKDRTHGAAWLSREALGVMKLATEKSEAKSATDFLAELTKVAARLVEAKPSMASIANRVSRFLYEVSQRSKDEKDLDLLRSFARSKGDELIRDSMQAALKAAENGAAAIEDGDILMTCSYSSTICQAFGIAKNGAKEIEVIALESKSYAEATARELKSCGIPVQIIPDNRIGDYILRAKKVLVGADSILGDGSLINGTPTYELARAAKRAGIPFYSVCETAKFHIAGYLGQRAELDEGFDLVPPQLITGIITEEGTIKPS